MFLVALGDFASGILIAHVLVRITDYRGLPILAVYAIAAAIAVLPDLDILIQIRVISKKADEISKHRELFHKPWLIIPVFAILYLFSAFWAYLISLCLLAHFVHDSTGSGYGIKWQPFSQNSYKFCVKKIICKWTPEEMAKNPWSPTLDQWLEEYYLRPTPEGIAGIFLALIALITILIW